MPRGRPAKKTAKAAKKKVVKDIVIKQENVSTPTKTSGKPPVYFLYHMSNGSTEEMKGKKKAELFEEENPGIILQKYQFATLKEFNAFKKNPIHVTPTNPTRPNPDANGVVTMTKMTDADRVKLEDALARIDEDRPSDRIELHYKTSSTSLACVFIIRFKTAEGKEDWRVKGDAMAVALRCYAHAIHQNDDTLDYALQNIESGVIRDPSGDQNKAFTNEWTSPETKRVMHFPYYAMSTHFLLPEELFEDSDEEEHHMKKTAIELGAKILEIMKTEAYADCLERAINNPRIWSRIGNPAEPNKHYVTFIKSCKVKAVKCENFNKHVVLSDATKHVATLYSHKAGEGAKYPTEVPDEDDSDNGSEDESDDDDEKSDEDDTTGDDEEEAEVEEADGGDDEKDSGSKASSAVKEPTEQLPKEPAKGGARKRKAPVARKQSVPKPKRGTARTEAKTKRETNESAEGIAEPGECKNGQEKKQ